MWPSSLSSDERILHKFPTKCKLSENKCCTLSILLSFDLNWCYLLRLKCHVHIICWFRAPPPVQTSCKSHIWAKQHSKWEVNLLIFLRKTFGLRATAKEEEHKTSLQTSRSFLEKFSHKYGFPCAKWQVIILQEVRILVSSCKTYSEGPNVATMAMRRVTEGSLRLFACCNTADCVR